MPAAAQLGLLHLKVEQQYQEATAPFSDHDLEVIAEFLERVARLSNDADAEATPG